MIYVVRIDNAPVNAIYIGRPSIYGNPIVLRQEADRSQVLVAYKRYLRNILTVRTELYYALEGLVTRAEHEDLYLACFCAPKPCHGDIIRMYIEYRLRKRQ